jgi:hypothetical protein
MNNSIGKGRGRILELLSRPSSIASKTSSNASESDSGYVQSLPSRGGGRGKIFELLTKNPKVCKQ